MYCPAASKVAEIMAWEDQRLDFGTIARIFGLDPRTLRLNGHFISRGVDLIASSVTWRSLLSFFSSRGLSTGTDTSGALVVDGKLCKSGAKRGHDPAPVVESGDKCISIHEEGVGIGRAFGDEVINSKKLKLSEMAICSDIGLKRKNWLDNNGPLIKKVRIDGSCSDEFSRGHEEREHCITKLHCGYQMRDTMKRIREEVIASSCKRAR